MRGTCAIAHRRRNDRHPLGWCAPGVDDRRRARPCRLTRSHGRSSPVALGAQATRSDANILGVALYNLFSAEDKYLAILRTGCFKYLERGGECIRGPVSLILGLVSDPILLSTISFPWHATLPGFS